MILGDLDQVNFAREGSSELLFPPQGREELQGQQVGLDVVLAFLFALLERFSSVTLEKREPFLGKAIFSRAATKKKEESLVPPNN